MARAGHFSPNPIGYREIMNGHEMLSVCQERGEAFAASASRQSGTDYAVDSIRGLNRIHTRVTTTSIRDYMRERHYNALSIAVGQHGGSTRPLSAAVRKVSSVGKSDKSVRRNAYRGWKSVAGGYRKAR